MATERRVEQLREEIAKRLAEASNLRERSDALMAAGDVDKAIDTRTRADATDRAVAHLRGKLGQILPSLAEERIRAAVPEIEVRVRQRQEYLVAEQKQAEKDFLAFFEAWNGLLGTGLGKRVAEQLLGHFGAAVLNAATDELYKTALRQHQVARTAVIDADGEKERAALAARIRAEVAAMAVVDVAAQETVSA